MRWSEREGCVCVVVCLGRLIKGGPGPKGGVMVQIEVLCMYSRGEIGVLFS